MQTLPFPQEPPGGRPWSACCSLLAAAAAATAAGPAGSRCGAGGLPPESGRPGLTPNLICDHSNSLHLSEPPFFL